MGIILYFIKLFKLILPWSCSPFESFLIMTIIIMYYQIQSIFRALKPTNSNALDGKYLRTPKSEVLKIVIRVPWSDFKQFGPQQISPHYVELRLTSLAIPRENIEQGLTNADLWGSNIVNRCSLF